MDIEGALQVADKAADRNTPAAEHPSLVNMIYALEILADGHRTGWQKAKGWEAAYDGACARRDEARREARDLNAELDRTQGAWSDLMEFIRTGLGLDGRATDKVDDVRAIIGGLIKDARLLARIRDEANGKFVAGSVVTADAMNTVGEAVKASRKTGMGAADTLWERQSRSPWTVRLDVNEAVKVTGTGGVWIAPEGTDPKNTGKWTLLGTVSVGDAVVVESQKRNTAAPTKLASSFPTRQAFPTGSPEPSSRVKRVARAGGVSTFTRAGCTVDGQSLWHEDMESDSAPLWLWAHLVRRHGVEEIL